MNGDAEKINKKRRIIFIVIASAVIGITLLWFVFKWAMYSTPSGYASKQFEVTAEALKITSGEAGSEEYGGFRYSVPDGMVGTRKNDIVTYTIDGSEMTVTVSGCPEMSELRTEANLIYDPAEVLENNSIKSYVDLIRFAYNYDYASVSVFSSLSHLREYAYAAVLRDAVSIGSDYYCDIDGDLYGCMFYEDDTYSVFIASNEKSYFYRVQSPDVALDISFIKELLQNMSV